MSFFRDRGFRATAIRRSSRPTVHGYRSTYLSMPRSGPLLRSRPYHHGIITARPSSLQPLASSSSPSFTSKIQAQTTRQCHEPTTSVRALYPRPCQRRPHAPSARARSSIPRSRSRSMLPGQDIGIERRLSRRKKAGDKMRVLHGAPHEACTKEKARDVPIHLHVR